MSAIPLLEVLVLLIDPKLPWSCNLVQYLIQNNGVGLLREIVLTGKVIFFRNKFFHNLIDLNVFEKYGGVSKGK